MPGTTTHDVRPITVPGLPDEQQPRRPLSRTSLGSRAGREITGVTTEVKLRRKSAKDSTTNRSETPLEQFLLTEVVDGDDDVTNRDNDVIDNKPSDWPTYDDEGSNAFDHYGNTSNDGDDDYVDINVDNGYDTDLEMDEEEFIQGPTEFDPSGVKDYIKECNKIGVIPCSYFARHVHDTHFSMKNHGLGPLGAKAISKPLEFNTSIERIDLEGNCIEGEGAKYLSTMLKENSYITDLILPENHIGSLGAKSLCETLAENCTVRWLDLSGNGLGDADGEYFLKLLENNSTISRLHLSHNNFGPLAAQAFKDALSANESLRILDLSWNHFRLREACILAEGIKENYGLKDLNLAMNGFAKEGAKAMGVALKQNQCLERLDLSSNRIDVDGVMDIARALQTNSDLKWLFIGKNPITHIGALALLTAIFKNDNTEMLLLNVAEVIVDDNFEDLHQKLIKARDLQVIHGGLMSKRFRIKVGGNKGQKWRTDEEKLHHLMAKLKAFIAEKNLRLVDLFKVFDKDNSWKVDAREFRKGIAKSDIDMTDEEIAFLAYRLDKDGDGEIDYGELAFADNQQRQRQRQIDKMAAEGTLPEVENDDDAASVCSVDAMLNALDQDLPD